MNKYSTYSLLYLPTKFFCGTLSILGLLCAFSFWTPSVHAKDGSTPLSQDFVFVGNSSDGTQSVAWGDWDGDGDLDLAIANGGDELAGAVNQVFENEGGFFSSIPAWESSDARDSRSLEWGDWDGDGDLDLAVGNHDWHNQVFENNGGALSANAVWESPDIKETHIVAWGDIDGDGNLDLAVGNLGAPGEDGPQPDQIYKNLGGTLESTPSWESTDGTYTYSLAWGDVDNDGDLDLAAGIIGNNRIYENSSGTLSSTPVWTATVPSYTYSLAWGDIDSDGDLDLAVANRDDYTWIFKNEEGQLATTPAWQSTALENTTHVAWGDWDSDGDLDLAATGWRDNQLNATTKVYQNSGETLNPTFSWEATEVIRANQAAWGDWDNDGDLDLAIANSIDCTSGFCVTAVNRIYTNHQGGGLDTAPSWVSIKPTGDDAGHDASSIAWGDVDNDGDLDLAVGNGVGGGQVNQVFENLGDQLNTLPLWESADALDTQELAWGDVDSDGDLDLAVGNWGDGSQVFINAGGQLRTTPAWSSGTFSTTTSVAWGDMDGDGDLDLAVGNAYGANEIYANDGRQLGTTPIWRSDTISITRSMAWGDMDGDGDLDLAEGNGTDGEPNQFNRVYQNDGGLLTLIWTSSDSKWTESVAWGDVDGDGDLDLAVGNINDVNQLFENVEGRLSQRPIWETTGNVEWTQDIEWGDWNGDGDLDLALATYSNGPQIYENDGNALASEPSWVPTAGFQVGWSIAWGDVDGDGDLDLATGNDMFLPNHIYENHSNGSKGLVNNQPSIQIAVPSPASNANFYASSIVVDSPTIEIPYTLFDPEGDPATRITAWYSYNGGGSWQPAAAAEGTATTNLQTSAAGVAHTFVWDTLASGFFGQSDNVRFRIDVIMQTGAEAGPESEPGRYQYQNQTPNLHQRPTASATTFPFRVQGTSVQVDGDLNSESENGAVGVAEAVADAIVFRLRGDQASDALLLADRMGNPYRTDPLGRLQGQGEVQIGDQLVAMQPVSITQFMDITFTQSVDLYFTSATPLAEGIDAHTVTEPGVQRLTVSKDNPLLLFNLDISLEWDARNDPEYLNKLERDLLRTSEIIYDLTDGQAALGNVWVYHDKMHWLDAHIAIHATNSLRPNASLGGIVNQGLDDTILNPTTVFTTTPVTIANAYLPGQVRIGTQWNRFGNKQGSQGEDWPRVLAHELGHYLFFQLDNYHGVTDEGLLTEVDCQNSVMTDPYVDAYSEFLYAWTDDCLPTVANQTTGRYDWETIRTFYPMLKSDGYNLGPTNLPLAVTNIQFIEPISPTNTLLSPFFSLLDETQRPLIIDDGQARGYLYTTRNTADPTDDGIIELGSPGRDQLFARGASPGDRICLFDNRNESVRLGCQVAGASEGNIVINQVADWPPDITVTPITSRTFTITVSANNASNISAQILPADGPASEEVALQQDGVSFTQVITTVGPAFSGYVRVWVPDAEIGKEALTEFSLGPGWLGRYRGWDGRYRGWDGRYRGWDGRYRGWDGRYRGWDGRYRGWDGRYRGWDGRYRGWDGRYRGWDGRYRGWDAPVHSTDGQVMLFNLDNILTDNSFYRLQALSSLPKQPLWFTQVGQAYRFSADSAEGDANGANSNANSRSSISFRYLERDVPASDESILQLYYLATDNDSGVDAEWEPLITHVDSGRNSASAQVQGEGVYALISTVELPPFNRGWNNFGYPVQGSRAITTALAALDDHYTTVYRHQPTMDPPWLIYDRAVAEKDPDLAEKLNTLTELDYGQGYWIHATEPITLYLGVSAASMGQDVEINVGPPVATYYGWITPTISLTPEAGMIVTAWADNTLCAETQIQSVDDRLAYVLQISPDEAGSAAELCTKPGAQLTFMLDGQETGVTQNWANGPAHFQSLSVVDGLEVEDVERSPSIDDLLPEATRTTILLPFAAQSE